jgi:hypothetical protein
MKTLTTLVVAGSLAFAVPALADAPSGSSSTPSPEKQCRTERTAMGVDTFRATYANKHGKNAFGRCVSQRASATSQDQQQAHSNAAKQCKAQEAADPTTFDATWGTNANHKNAYGKCVSTTAKSMETSMIQHQVKADVKHARKQHKSH